MSTHYTSSRPKLRWYPFVVNLFIPAILIAATANAWADGLRNWEYLFTAMTNLYILSRGAKGLTGKYAHETFFAVLGIELYGVGAYQFAIGNPDSTLIVVMLVISLVSAVCAVVARHDRLLKSPFSLTKSNLRAADFPGIYRITCLPNGKQYIGQTSQTINARWSEHRMMLHSQRHHNRWMQADWDLYRPEQFMWEVLEVVTDPVWLLDRERAWQDKDYDASKRYNPPNIAPRVAKANRRPPMKRKRPA